MESTIDLQFVEYIVKSLVGKPEEVKIKRTIDEKGVLLELTVDPEDLGRVIGKRGATAQSLRTLLRALGTKNDARYNLKIVDNGEPRPPREDREPREERGDRDDRSSRSDQGDRENRDRDSRDSDSNDSQPENDHREDREDEPEKAAHGVVDDDAWTSATAAVTAKKTDDDADEDDSHSSAISRARKDLAELDDLDI